MKKFLFIIASCLCFLGVSLADDLPTGMTITLNPGWNVVSTPTVLSNVSFSNGGDGISFMYLEGTEWKNTVITPSNVASVFKPLEGFLVKNNNSQDVQMTLTYDMNIDIAGVMREKEIRAGWNFLGITKTENPFEKIVSTTASIIVDFTRKFYNGASVSYMTENPTSYEIGKAYGVFADKNGIYGGLTAFLSNIDCNEPNIAAACTVDSVDCPAQCQTSYQEVTGIKLQNTNLGNVTVSKGALYVLIGEGNLLVERAVTIPSFSVTADNTGVQSLVFVANGNEYTASTTDGLTFTFENVQIPKSGKVRFSANIASDAVLDRRISLGNISKDVISSAKYSDTNELVGTENIAGTISLSNIFVAAPRVSMGNTLPGTNVAFPLDDTATETVYSGIYSVQVGDINLNRVRISKSDNLPSNMWVTFLVFINNNKVAEVAAIGPNDHEETFSDILVQAGESVNVRVDAEVEAYGEATFLPEFTLTLGGADLVGDEAGNVSDTVSQMKVVDGSKVTISGNTYNNVLLSTANSTITEFVIKPADIETSTLDTISFDMSLDGTPLTASDIKFLINGLEYQPGVNGEFSYTPNISINKTDGATVKIVLKRAVEGTVVISNLEINGNVLPTEFENKYVKAIVYIASQENRGDETVFTLGVTHNGDYEVRKVTLYTGDSNPVSSISSEVVDGDEMRALGYQTVQYITKITYEYKSDFDENRTPVEITKQLYNNYFKVGADYAKIFKASD